MVKSLKLQSLSSQYKKEIRIKEFIMIGQLNHIAIAVPNLEEAANVYRNILGAKVTDPVALPCLNMA